MALGCKTCGLEGPHGIHTDDCPNREHHLGTCAVLAGVTRAHGCTCGLEPKKEKPAEKWFGDIRKMPEDIFRKRYEAAKREVQEFNNENARRAALTSEMKLADRLHDLLHWKVDCDYHYSDWPNTAGCRSVFYSLAMQLVTDLHGRGPLEALVSKLEKVARS